MRIATWNVERKHGKQIQVINKQIEELSADIWVLTETNKSIGPGEKYAFCFSEPVPGPHDTGEHWAAIYSRWPILQIIPTATPDISICAEIDAPGARLIVYGTVLPYHRELEWRSAGQEWQAHYMAIACQGADWDRLKKKFPSHLHCIAGDFNQNRDGVHQYGTAWGRGLLTCALETSDLVCLTQEDMIRNGKLKVYRNIDHICISKSWISKSSEPVVWNEDRKLSDHNGIYIDLDFS